MNALRAFGRFFVRIEQAIVSLAVGLLLVFGFLALASSPANGQYSLVWSDEFNGASVDLTKWTFESGNNGGWGNNELEFYTTNSANAYVTNGFLHIRAQIQPTNGFHYTSARMKTQGLFNKQYGRIEWRAKLPAGTGMWPALWALGSSNIGWPAEGEIDVVENNGANPTFVQGSLHWGGDTTAIYNFTSGDSTTNFHVYDLDWTNNSITWSVDGVAYQHQAAVNTFNAPFYFLMNLAVGGNYVGNPSTNSIDPGMPGEMVIDYMRVYDYVATTNPPATPTGLTATPVGGSIALNWSASTGAANYNVKRSSVSGGSYTTIATLTATNYTDTGVPSCSTYYYVVSATNSIGESTNSIEAFAALNAPATPTGLTASPGGSSIALNWTASPGTANYNVKRSSVSGGSYTTIATLSATTYTDTGLATCASYYYVVSGTNSCGESTNSTEAVASLGSYYFAVNSGGSAAGTFVADTDVTGGTIAATSTATIVTTGVTNPAPQAVYKTERYGNFQYAFGGLTTGTTYTVRLHEAEIYFNAAAKRQFNVFINGSQVLTNFDIFAAAGGENIAVVRQYSVIPKTNGQISITYSNGALDQAKSSGIEIILPAPVAPTGLTATATVGQVTLNWNAVSGATGYNVKRSTVSGGSYSNVAGGVTSTNYTDTTVTSGITYYYVVSSLKSSCEGANSSEASAIIPSPSAFAQWQVQYFGSTTNPATAPNIDADGTGQNNQFKYVAGLDPTNPASVFVLDIVTDTNQSTWQDLTFEPMAAGRTYTLQFSTDLVEGVWMPLTTYTGPVTNGGTQVTITDTNAVLPQEFYRIQISSP
jgi:beta-glucanase (GH16 family)